MPELPEVETVRRGLERALRGAVIGKVTLRRAGLRIPFPVSFVQALTGRAVRRIARRAKYLLFYLDSDDVLIAHLGMTGRFIIKLRAPKLTPHDHVLIRMKDGRVMIFNDARRFGLMTLAKKTHLDQHPLLADLGPEPLGRAFTAEYLRRELARRGAPVKTALMDQQLVVGVGNIYASEALFLAGIDPRTPGRDAASRASEMVLAIRKVLRSAIASGGSSLRDFLHVTGREGAFQHAFNVYGRQGEPCLQCGTPIRSLRMAGRSTYFCPECQT